MKTIIAGSRSITDYGVVSRAFQDCPWYPTEIVSGGARGVDSLGEQVAANYNIDVKRFKPDWKGLGKAAGILRNMEMGDYADALVAVWDGKSKGTEHMINYMKSLGKPVFIYSVIEETGRVVG